MRRTIGNSLSTLGLLALLLATSSAAATPALQLVETSAEGMELELTLPIPALKSVELDGRSYTELRLPGCAYEDRPGHPALPFVARLIAVPPGARVEIEILEADFVELREVDLPPVPEYAGKDPEQPLYIPDVAAYATSVFLPEERVAIAYTGQLRGVSAHALRLYPFSYNPSTGKLRVYTHLRVRLRFEGGRRPRAARQETATDGDLYGAFLNSAQAPQWSAPSPATKRLVVDDWYDPTLPWIKVYVTEDGLFRIDPAWLGRYGAPEDIDPRTLRLFYRGEEQALDVKGQEDGRFDEEDYLVFYGRFRRDDREFGSLYGRRNVYWLTWGGEVGRRFVERSGAPINDFPQARSFRSTAHFEVDIEYDPLPDAPDADGDHWFWDKPVRATKPEIPSSRTYAGSLVAPDLETEESAVLRVALHGSSNLPHHTVTKLNNLHTVSDTIWGARGAGQIELRFESKIPHSYLKNGTNRLLLQVFADQEKFDLVYMNWFALEYRRLYKAEEGYLEFGRFSAEEQRITLSGLRDTDVELYDVANGIRFTQLQIGSAGGGVEVTFEDASPPFVLYAAADSRALKTPRGQLDEPSSWRSASNGADYLIIAHPSLLGQGKRLADHRSTQGLQVELISSEDLYDEFSHGLFDRRGIADFIRYAYDHWDRRPAYVLLLGDDTYDYRSILGSGVMLSVPTLYYQSRGRGRAPSDYLYSLVDGDDLLPDLAIGRLATSVRGEARQIVGKIIDYDLNPEPGDWRSRAIYLANHHVQNFTDPSDSLAARYTEPLGLTSVKVYNPDESPVPNAVGKEFLEALNDGALLLNFSGHGSAPAMQYVFAADQPDWGYLSQVRNGRRLPLVLAFSCLNGLFVNPKVEGLAELFTNRAEGGAIAYISATAKSFVAQNNLMADLMYEQLFVREDLAFGPVLNSAKAQVLAAHSSYLDAALTMQLFGDPAQKLALLQEPDYVAEDLQVDADPLFGHATVQVRATLRNAGRRTADSLEVILLGQGNEAASPETLFVDTPPSFTGTKELSFTWPTGTRRGSYDLELILDAGDRVAELDEGNNRLRRQLEILAPLRAEPVFPSPSAVVDPSALKLEAIAPLEGDFACEFILSGDPNFAPDSSSTSSSVNVENGKATFFPEPISEGQPFFWKVRLLGSRGTSDWSAFRSFSVASADSSTWQQRGPQLLVGAGQGTALTADGLILSPERPPFRPNTATRDSGFTVRGLDGVGVLTMDGRYVYAKRWYNDDSTIYEGIDFFTRVGTGFSGTFRTGHFGILADSTTAGISATWHSDGYIYSECGKQFQLERIVPATGKLDIVEVPDGLLEWQTGPEWTNRPGINNHALITSDGQFIYSASMSSAKGMRAEWSFRVFDPAADWALVREFTSPPTENGFTYKWTDGLVADGERLYLIEYGGQRRIRMIDAVDGRFLDEWTSDQDVTRAITGQYDWLNDKIWLGDLRGSAIFQYSRLPAIDSTAVLSETIGPAAAWEELRLAGEGDLRVDLLVEGGGDWVPHPEFTGLLPGEGVDLQSLDAGRYPRIRLRAVLKGEPQTAVLRSWSADFAPLPSLRMARAEGRRQGAGLQVELHVRNLSPFAVEEAQILLERSDQTEPLLAQGLPSLVPGATEKVLLDSLEIPPEGVRLFARVQTPLADAQPEDDRLEVPLLFGGRAPMSFVVWPERVTFLSGDPLRPDQRLEIAAPGLPGSQLKLAVDGTVVDPDSTLDSLPEDGPRILYRPQLTPGNHRMQVRLLRGGEELGVRELRFRLDAGLVVANPLVYPHPMREEAAFTWVLSLDAEVEVEIYSLSGRLVRRLGPASQTAGFGLLEWDGRDADGQRLANGTFLYLLRARSGDQKVVFRGPLVIIR